MKLLSGARRIRGGLLAAALALATSSAPQPGQAQDFAPVAIVNDAIITNFDVAQRARLLQSASQGGGGDFRRAAVEGLIEDTLRLQAAKRFGIVPTQQQINAGFDELAAQNGSDGATMRRFFESQGVSPEALSQQVAAEVAWRQLIRQRYLPRVRVSESEIAEAVRSATGDTETQYLIAEIRLPIGAQRPDMAMQRARGVLARLGSGADFASVAREVSQGPSAALGGDIGWVPQSALSPAAQGVVAGMSVDRVSAPFVDGDEVVLYGLRAVRAPGQVAPTRYRLSQVVVGVQPNAPQPVADTAYQQALAARARVTDCASIEAIKGQYLPISGSLGETTLQALPGPVRQAVEPLETGGISQPIRSNDGFHIVVVCEKVSAGAADTAALETKAREALTARKLARYSKSLLNDLKREAIIERR